MSGVIDRLVTAASHTYTDEARAAIEDGADEIRRLEAEVATWRAMYESAWNIVVCEKWWRTEMQMRLAKGGPHGRESI